MTPAEFDAADDYDDLCYYELINGVLVVVPLPEMSERAANDHLGSWLPDYAERHPNGKFLDCTLYSEWLGVEDRRRVARAIWTGLGRVPRLRRDWPSICVDFVSTARQHWQRDYDDIRAMCFGMGVREYWLVNRFTKSMTVWRANSGRVRKSLVGAKETYRTPLLPGFELALKRLLEIALRWGDKREPVR